MKDNRIKLFWSVLGISFVGSLPPGILNTGVTGLAATSGPASALWFGLGAIAAEMTIVRIAHAGIVSWRSPSRSTKWIGIGLSLLLLPVLLYYSSKSTGHVQYARYPFPGGVLLGTLNPLHLPFWLGWTAVLRTKKLLSGTKSEYDLFSAGIGGGTALAFVLYGFAGHYIIQWLHKG